jgi:ABC-2 type transport system ATP-binding protein
MSVISVQHIQKSFGKTQALRDVTFEVEKGEIFGFLGPNGSGKTTTIRCVMDFLHPDNGTITILDKDAHRNSVELKKYIGYLSSDIHLYSNWTGKDHIQFMEAMEGKSKIVDDLIKRFQFDPKIKAHHLSTGNKQKLGIILTLMSEPELLVLDEPTRGLDPLLQNEIYDILKELQKKGHTIFMSSHNLGEVQKICTRIGIIKNGKVVDIANLEDMREKSVHLVYVYFYEKVSKDDFVFDGIEVEKKFEYGLALRVKGDLNPLLKKLATYKVKDVEITHANLEDIFLEFYKNNNDANTHPANS